MKTIIETFREVGGHSASQLKADNTSCFNGMVNVEKYRITIEKIEETKEVYKDRLQKLWGECDNHHHWTPLQEKAKELGVELEGKAGNMIF